MSLAVPFRFEKHTNSRTGHTAGVRISARPAHTEAHSPHRPLSAMPESSVENTNLDLQHTTWA